MKVLKAMIARAWRLPPAEWWLVVEAVAALATARLVLAVLPFTQAMARLGLRPRVCPEGTPAFASDPAPTVHAVQRAMGRGRKLAPFRAVCLQQAVAASLMLRRRGVPVEVHFGVALDDIGALRAHAWSVCLGTVITGGQTLAGHVRIAVFVP